MCPVGPFELEMVEDRGYEAMAQVFFCRNRKFSQDLGFLAAVVCDPNLDRHVFVQLLVSCKPARGVRSMAELFENRVSFLELIIQLDRMITAGSISV